MTSASLDKMLAGVATMSPAELGSSWRRLRKEPPPSLSIDLLRRSLGWHLQLAHYGGLSRDAERELAQLAAGIVPALPARASASLRAGTRLVRSWHGTTYAVLVTHGGFEFDGRAYTSLTNIAREITGAAWSGPRFFGLRASAGRNAKAKATANA